MSCPKCQGRSRHRWPVFLLIIAGVVLATAVFAAEPALTLDEAGRLAQERQPQLAAQAAGIAALREEAVAAAQLPDPKLVLGVEGVPVDSFSLTRQEMTQTVVGLSQMIPGGAKLALAGRRLEHQASRGAIALEADRRRVEREARLAWLDVYAADAAFNLAKAIETEFDRQAEWSQVAYKTGQMAQDETLALRAMLEGSRNRAADLAGRRTRAQAGLERWLGEAGRRPPAALPPMAAPAPLADLAARLNEHPEVRALMAGLESGRVDSEMARQAYKPDWSVDFAYGIRGEGRPDTVKLMVGVDLPLFPEKRQDRRLAARLAEVQQMEAMLEDRRRMLAADLTAAWADWQSADTRLQRQQHDILPLATQRIDSTLTAYKTGRAGYDRVLEARRAELEARLEQLDLEVARAKAAVALQYYE
ncbi:MAG: TolC family protein [Thiobacillus sp.]|nr:TolC family protein [Thiobacillus sp.]